MKVFYHNDTDGRCAGAVIYHYINSFTEVILVESNFFEMEYSKPFPLDIVKPNETVYILDFHVQDDDEFRQLQRITKNIILIDHHKTTLQHREEHPELYENLKLCVLDVNHSGCWLTWEYVTDDYLVMTGNDWPEVPMAIKLIDDMDRWVWQYPGTKGFTVGLKLYPHQPWDEVWTELFGKHQWSLISRIAVDGETCAKFDDMVMNDYCNKYGWETEFEGHKAFAQGQYRGGSTAFGKRITEYPLCLSYEFLGDKWIVGLYSETIDVSEIAAKYGGGGHKGASGFVCRELPFRKTGDE